MLYLLSFAVAFVAVIRSLASVLFNDSVHGAIQLDVGVAPTSHWYELAVGDVGPMKLPQMRCSPPFSAKSSPFPSPSVLTSPAASTLLADALLLTA